MIVRVTMSWEVRGEGFSPLKIPKVSSWRISDSNEVGEVALVGKFRGKPLPYGAASISPISETVSSLDLPVVLLFLDDVLRHKDSVKLAGGAQMHIDIAVFYADQCGFDMGSNLLSALAALRMPICLSCYLA